MINYNNDKPIDFNKIIKYEKIIYKEQLIGKNEVSQKINLINILSRKISRLRDKTFNMPQNIFILENKDFPPIVGRKILSDLYIKNKINALNCSKITSSMILGFLKEKKVLNNDLSIKYYPFTNWEKINIFKKVAKDRLTNIFFPFYYINFDTKKEKECSPEGWKLSPEKVINLSNWEKHFREYTKTYFSNIIKDWYIIYDPACSTGTFLSSIKENFPLCRTIGQDLSKEMTEYAKDFVDEIYTGDAINSPLPNNYVDIMFLRFLNSEIVTSSNAYILFDTLAKKVKINGYIVLFWHTPVLLKQDYFCKHWNFKILHSSGHNINDNSIFQYYILKKN